MIADRGVRNEGPDVDGADIVGVEEVVAEIELGEVEGYLETRVVGRELRCAD